MVELGNALTSLDLSGIKLSEFYYDTEARTPEHTHDETYFCLALHGQCTEASQGKVFEHRQFSVSFLPAGFSHAVHYRDGPFRWFCMIIGSVWLNRLNEYFEQTVSPLHSRGGQLNDLFVRLHREYCHPDTLSPLVIEALACEMFAEVARRKTQTDRVPPRWLLAARDYLEANSLRQINLTTVAAAVDTHPVHLAREFRKYFNCTVGEYIRNMRVELVRRQLANSTDPLVEIALATGFYDQSHLTRVFKNIVGITPAQYRATSNSCNSGESG